MRGGQKSTSNSVAWDVFFALGSLPNAISSVYQQRTFGKSAGVDPFAVNFYASCCQFIVIAALLPMNFVKPFAGTGDFWHDTFTDGWNCVVHATPATVPMGGPCEDLAGCTGCSAAAFNCIGAVMLMLLSNLLQTILIKVSSASLQAVVFTITFPLQGLLVTQPWLMGWVASTVHITDVVCLALVLVGIVLYRYGGQAAPEEDASGELLDPTAA